MLTSNCSSSQTIGFTQPFPMTHKRNYITFCLTEEIAKIDNTLI